MTVVVVVTVVLVVDVDVRVVPVMVALVVVIVTVEIVVLVDVHANPHITSQFVVANVRIASSLEKQSDFGIRNPHTIASVLPSQLPGMYFVVVSVEVLTVLVVAVVVEIVAVVVTVDTFFVVAVEGEEMGSETVEVQTRHSPPEPHPVITPTDVTS